MRNSSVTIFLILLSIVMSSCRKQTQEVTLPTSTPSLEEEALKNLNDWNPEELEALECPSKYPGRVVSGETNAWVSMHKQELQSLGLNGRWNCEKKVYEIIDTKQSSVPICECR